MNDQNDIAEKHWFTNKQVISLIVAVVIATFTLTGIWFEFEYLKAVVAEIYEKIDYNNIRSDKKDARLQDDIDSNTEALKELREKHPDSNKK